MEDYDEQLLPYQEECVLNFMDIMSITDREVAISMLQSFNFDLQVY